MRTFVYDCLKRLTSATNPESGTTTYTYDNNGNVVKRTDARGRITCYGNPFGRRLRRSTRPRGSRLSERPRSQAMQAKPR